MPKMSGSLLWLFNRNTLSRHIYLKMLFLQYWSSTRISVNVERAAYAVCVLVSVDSCVTGCLSWFSRCENKSGLFNRSIDGRIEQSMPVSQLQLIISNACMHGNVKMNQPPECWLCVCNLGAWQPGSLRGVSLEAVLVLPFCKEHWH